jgi:5-deoxy-glucuronate isomerase
MTHLPARSTSDGPFATVVTPESAGWAYSGLRVADLAPNAQVEIETGPDEALVLPLTGSATVHIGSVSFGLTGRASVFDRVSDFCYVPIGSSVRIETETGGRFAIPTARATRRLEPRYVPADDVPVEIRGAGQATRQVNNFCAPDTFETARLCAVEVLTPAGNWSSYPPHKHDEDRPGEAVLEEIYYFEVESTVDTPGMGYQRAYRPGPDRPVDLCVEVRSGDVVLIPHGYHGPSMAPPGYPLYYLNVLAGPADRRSMAFSDDPAHHWIRASWADHLIDPRVPMTTAGGRAW